MGIFKRMKRKRHRKKKPFMNTAVAFVLATVFAFTIVWTIAFWRTGTEPGTLITCFFAFMGVEGGCMAWIKNVKTKEDTKAGIRKPKPQEEQDEDNAECDGEEDDADG